MTQFHVPNESDLAYFRTLLPGRVFAGEDISTDYTHDEMTEYGAFRPDAVLQALTTEEVSAVLAYCNEKKIAVTPRGAGTGLCGGCVPIRGGIVLSTEKMKKVLEAMPEVSDVRANREVTVRTLRIDYDLEALAEAGLTLREAGEQVSAAFNGVEVGEVRDGLKRRAVVVRLEGADAESDPVTVKSLLLCGRGGRKARLDEVAVVVPEESSDLLLREGGRRKALVSLNPAEGVDAGELVRRLRERLVPVAVAAGCSVELGGSYQARESAGRRLAALAVALIVFVFLILLAALREFRLAALALVNVPLGLIGGVAAVALANPVLSVSSLVGFVTVIGFVLRNGILLLQRYRERMREGLAAEEAIRHGSTERMVPIVMTSLTTVLGLVPLVLAGEKPGGELLAPLAVVQFGGILGAMALNLVVVPAAAKLALGGKGK